MTTESSGPPAVLIVEDEWIVAAMTEDTVRAAGYDVIGPARRPAEALEMLAATSVIGAFLDVSIGKEMSFEVADELMRRAVPFVFMTGYLAEDLPSTYRSVTILAKPVSPQDIERALKLMSGKALH